MQMFDVALSRRMCCSRSERHSIRGVPVGIDRHADADQHLTDICRARGEECRMGATVTERHAESLRVSEHHICPHLTARSVKREKIGATADENAGLVGPLDERPQVLHGSRPRPIRIVRQRGWGRCQTRTAWRRWTPPGRRCRAAPPAAQHVDRLWKTAVAYQENAARIAIACRRCRPMLHSCGAHTVQQRHRFRRGRRFVEQ